MDIIICPDKLKKLLVSIGVGLLLTKPQFKHFVAIIISSMHGGFDGKIKNVPELSMRNIHRTSVGYFLAKSPWSTDLTISVYQRFAISQIRLQAAKTGCSVFVILDDTVAKRTKPSSKAKRPIEGCGIHWSNLEKRKVYGHQIVGVLLVCGDLKLPYYIDLYDKAKQSKIATVRQVIESLPDFPTQVYVLGDCWYSAEKVIKAARSRRFEYVGALRANRVLHTTGGSKLGLPINDYVKTLSKNDVHLVTVGKHNYWVHRVNGYNKKLPKGSIILLSWPENKLFEEKLTHVFVSTRNLPDDVILNTYCERWKIEVFFRDNKMQLELDRYQVRTVVAIKRFLIILMFAYAYCITTGPEDLTLGESRKEERDSMKRNLVTFVYQQTKLGVSLNQINEQLGLA